MCPTVAQYQYLLGVGLMTAGDTLSASAPLAKADALGPDRPLTLTALGLALQQPEALCRREDARCTRSLELDPDNIETLAALAEAEAGLGDIDGRRNARRACARKGARRMRPRNLVIGMVRMTQQRYRGGARCAARRRRRPIRSSPKPNIS